MWERVGGAEGRCGVVGGGWGAGMGGRWQPKPPLAVFKHIQTQLIKDTQIDPLKSSSLRKALLWLHRSSSPHPPSGALGSGGAMSPAVGQPPAPLWTPSLHRVPLPPSAQGTRSGLDCEDLGTGQATSQGAGSGEDGPTEQVLSGWSTGERGRVGEIRLHQGPGIRVDRGRGNGGSGKNQ